MEVLRTFNEKRTILNALVNRRGKMIGHLTRHFETILEGDERKEEEVDFGPAT